MLALKIKFESRIRIESNRIQTESNQIRIWLDSVQSESESQILDLIQFELNPNLTQFSSIRFMRNTNCRVWAIVKKSIRKRKNIFPILLNLTDVLKRHGKRSLYILSKIWSILCRNEFKPWSTQMGVWSSTSYLVRNVDWTRLNKKVFFFLFKS